jgi:hypothetical protein
MLAHQKTIILPSHFVACLCYSHSAHATAQTQLQQTAQLGDGDTACTPTCLSDIRCVTCRVLEKADQGAEWMLYVLLGELYIQWMPQ